MGKVETPQKGSISRSGGCPKNEQMMWYPETTIGLTKARSEMM